jgi:anti-sigma B factor antagonist
MLGEGTGHGARRLYDQGRRLRHDRLAIYLGIWMNITAENRSGKILLSVQEERLDANNSGELKEYLQHQVENQAKALVLDLSAVRFIDSSGLGALLSGYKNANLHQGSLVLSGLQPRVQSMFELTRLHRVFDIYPSPQEALDHTEEGNTHE